MAGHLSEADGVQRSGDSANPNIITLTCAAKHQTMGLARNSLFSLQIPKLDQKLIYQHPWLFWEPRPLRHLFLRNQRCLPSVGSAPQEPCIVRGNRLLENREHRALRIRRN